MSATIRLQREPFDAAREVAKLTRGRTDIGAVVTFTGICRGEEAGTPLLAMTLEHYPEMAEAEIAGHVQEAESRWALLGVTVIHRFGRIEPGYVASLTVLNLARPTTIRRENLFTKCGWSPLEGVTFPGSVEAVFVDGRLVAPRASV